MAAPKLTPPEFKLPEKIDLAYADNLEATPFEHFVGALLKTRGYSQVMVTQPGNDFGADVIASRNGKKYAVQAKRYHIKNGVGSEIVQKVVGSCKRYGCQQSMIVTTSYFTKPAKKEAPGVDCELVDRDGLRQWLDEYNLSVSEKPIDQVRLRYLQHRVLITRLAVVGVLVLLFLLFNEPLCEIFC